MAVTKAEFKCGETTIKVHFNPATFSINSTHASQASKSEEEQDPMACVRAPSLDKKEKPRETLSLELIFDTYTMFTDMATFGPDPDREDVRNYTDKIVALMEELNTVTFVWGSTSFEGVIISVNQKFTMFMGDGKPVRASLTVSMSGVSTGRDTFVAAVTTDRPAFDENWKTTLAGLINEEGGNPRTLLES